MECLQSSVSGSMEYQVYYLEGFPGRAPSERLGFVVSHLLFFCKSKSESITLSHIAASTVSHSPTIDVKSRSHDTNIIHLFNNQISVLP